MKREKVCAVCGKPLPHRRLLYCSDACRAEHERQKRLALTPKPRTSHPWHTITCPDCGREVRVHAKSYRCRECQREANQRANVECKRRAAAGKTRQIGSVDICRKCGNPYTVNSGAQLYCKDCATAAIAEGRRAYAKAYYHDRYDHEPVAKLERSQKRRLPRYDPIQCPICGSVFIPETERSVYCSKKCADEGRRKAAAAWAQDHQAEKAEAFRRWEQSLSPERLEARRKKKVEQERERQKKLKGSKAHEKY